MRENKLYVFTHLDMRGELEERFSGIRENFSAAEWRLVTIIGNTMPPRDPNDDNDDDDDEDDDTEPNDEREPPVVREPDEDE